MSYDARFHAELTAAREQGYKPHDACQRARQRAKPVKDLRALWSFYCPSEAEVRQVEALEQTLAKR